jgi:hypothetical protein
MTVERKFPRINEGWSIAYRILEKEATPKDSLNNFTVNISGGGICFFSKYEIVPNTTLAIEMDSEEIPSPVMALARVVWCNTANHEYEVGAEFLWVGWKDNNAQQTIANHISSTIEKTYQEKNQQ